MTTEGWPDDRLTSSDAPSLVRHHAGPAEDPDRYELLGEADGTDEAWHVLDHRAAAGEALFTLAALRPRDVADLEVRHAPDGRGDGDEEGDEDGATRDEVSPDELWRERAAGLARVRHARLAGVVDTFSGPAPHPPGQAVTDGPEWSYAVLEQAAGRSVADWLRDDPGAGVEERFTVLATAASVLSELHRGSEDAPPLVHGDITPRSVRLGGFWPADGVRLAGASLGGLRHGPLRRSPGAADSPYTAPEVRAGALPSAAADVFGFGATALFLLTGSAPATSPDGAVEPALVRRQLGAAPLTAPHPGLADLLLQALSPDPAQRPDRLPAWVNGMRALVEPRPSLDDYDGRPAPTQFVPVARAGATRSLPKRPVVVVVGALLLATAGTAVAIAAVQQGRLRDVPNPVAIVQPPQESAAVPTTAPTTSVPAPGTSTDGTGQQTGGGAQAPATRRSTSAPAPARTSDQGPAQTAEQEPAQTPSGSPLPSSAVPPLLAPPFVTSAPPAETPTASAVPPVTGPAPVPTTTTTPPPVRPTPSTPSTIRPPTRTPPVLTPPTRTPVVTPPVVTPGTPTRTQSLPPVTPSTPVTPVTPVTPSTDPTTTDPADTPTATTGTAPGDPLTPRGGSTP